MTDQSLAPEGVNHVAYLTMDTGATFRFYTEVMGCRLVAAVKEDRVPSIDEETAFLHTFFAMKNGQCLAFFEIDRQQPPKDDGVPDWVRHIALTVDSLDELEAWQQHLREHSVEFRGPVDHEGIWTSIYFFDPNGIRLELTHQNRRITEEDAADAQSLLERWAAERDLALSKA